MTQLELITSNENAEPVAGLNEKTYALSYTMTVAEDQSTSTYEFILKNGLTFADGTPSPARTCSSRSMSIWTPRTAAPALCTR